jgi:hypothetical protein
MAVERVKRLKDLVEMVQRLPESPERERLLGELRSRAVDLDTGVTPREMLPMREPTPAPVAVMPARRPVTLPRPVPAPPTPRRDPQPAWDDVLRGAAHLSLDDSPDAAPSRDARPWTLGLRG